MDKDHYFALSEGNERLNPNQKKSGWNTKAISIVANPKAKTEDNFKTHCYNSSMKNKFQMLDGKSGYVQFVTLWTFINNIRLFLPSKTFLLRLYDYKYKTFWNLICFLLWNIEPMGLLFVSFWYRRTLQPQEWNEIKTDTSQQWSKEQAWKYHAENVIYVPNLVQ